MELALLIFAFSLPLSRGNFISERKGDLLYVIVCTYIHTWSGEGWKGGDAGGVENRAFPGWRRGWGGGIKIYKYLYVN